MPIAMPSTPESLTYALAGALGLTVLAGLVLLFSGDLLAAVLVLALAAATRRAVARNLAVIVTAREAAAAVALLLVLCALADLVTRHPYEAVIFLLAAASLGFAFLLLQRGTMPAELRLGGSLAVGATNGPLHLRMLEELRDAGILSPEEFAAKRASVGR